MLVATAVATGGDLGSQQRVSNAGPDGDTSFAAIEPAVAYNSTTNQYLAVWYGSSDVNGEIEVYGRLLGPDGAPAGSEIRISTAGPDGDTTFRANRPAVAYNPVDNEYMVVWEGEDSAPLADNEFEIFAQRLSAAGAELGTDDMRISTMGPDGDPGYDALKPTIVHNQLANQYMVAWEGEDNTAPLVDNEFEIFVQRLSAVGAEVGPDDQRISAMGPDGDVDYDAQRPTATYNSTNNEYLVAWQSDDDAGSLADNEREIYAQRLTTLGAEAGPDDARISSMGPDGDTDYQVGDPTATYNRIDNEYLVAWFGDDSTAPLVNNENEIFAQRLTTAGAEIGTDDQQVSSMGPDGNPEFEAVTPTASYNGDANEYLIAWAADDDTPPQVDEEFEIFAQRLSGDGAERGIDDQRVSSMGPDGDDSFGAFVPSSAYNSVSREYLVAWGGDDDTPPLVANETEIFARSVAPPTCADGADNDGDGLVDFPADPGCESVADEDETDPPPDPAPDPAPDPDPDPTPDPDTEVTDPDVSLDKKIFVKGKEFKVKVSVGAQENTANVGTATLIEKKKRKKGKGKGSAAAKKTKRTKLRAVTKSTEAGERTILRHKFKGAKKKRQKLTEKLKRKIKKGKVKARVRVKVVLTDEAANTATEKRVARLKVKRGRKR